MMGTCKGVRREIRHYRKVEVGQRYGHLTVLELDDARGKQHFDLARCECGVEKRVRRMDMQSGRVVSCGCRAEAWRAGFRAKVTTHGDSQTKLYNWWAGSKRTKGKLCAEWLDWVTFRDAVGGVEHWDDGKRPYRENPEAPFGPGNFEWL